MKSKRRQFTAEFKAKVAVEAIKGQRTTNEIASQYGVHPTQIIEWKKHVLTRVSELFAKGSGRAEIDLDAVTAPLYQQIGQLKVELDWLKKVSGTVG
jgi:putative transposase